MTLDVAAALIDQAMCIDAYAPILIGCEPETRAMDPRLNADILSIGQMLWENRIASVETYLVYDDNDLLTIWVRKPNTFWGFVSPNLSQSPNPQTTEPT